MEIGNLLTGSSGGLPTCHRGRRSRWGRQSAGPALQWVAYLDAAGVCINYTVVQTQTQLQGGPPRRLAGASLLSMSPAGGKGRGVVGVDLIPEPSFTVEADEKDT